MKKRKKIGLALGGGSARGLCHIGVLKILHRYGIYPDYVAGTSMGAVIGAMYAAGHSPEEIEEIAKTTDWKNIIDFTLPKAGLVQGRKVENMIRTSVFNKKFKNLDIPFKAVAYNLSNHQQVLFDRGDVAKAVRASLSIPGLFAPVKIGKNTYVDGGISNPTPFDVVREMGADIVIAVDLFSKQSIIKGYEVKDEGFLVELREKFIGDELARMKKIIIPDYLPKFLLRLIRWIFDRLLYPARILKIMAGREMPEISKVMYNSITSLISNLAVERMKHAIVDIKITPSFGKLQWSDFDHSHNFVKIGEKAMLQKMPELKKLMKR